MRALVMLMTLILPAPAGPAVFPEGSEWETVSKGHAVVEGIAAAADGSIYLTDVPDAELFKLGPDGRETVFARNTDKANGLAIAPDGRLFGACMGKPVIAAWSLKTGERAEFPLPSPANDLVITSSGVLYATWGPEDAVYRIDPAKSRAVKVADVRNPNGITLSQDGGELWVGEFSGDTVRAFPIRPDGSLGPPRAAFRAKVPPDGRGLLDGMTPLADGRLLVATALGLQILSANADPVLIPNPTSHRANYVRLIADSEGRRWIYAAHEKTVIRRRTTL